MSVLTEMVFDSLEPVRVPIKVGDMVIYWLCSADSETVRLQNTMITKMAKIKSMGADGKTPDIEITNLDGAADIDMMLLSRCLVDFKTNAPVPAEILKGWDSQVVGKLVERLKEISGMNAQESTVKNSPGATVGISA